MAELRRNSPHFCSMPDPKDSVKHLYFSELESTQAWAHENPDSWCPSGWTAITAGTQRQGRGSGGSTWTDVPGSSLLMTLVSPAIEWSAPYVFVRHAQASLCTAEWLQERGVEARLKWPNDLYLNRLKLGGFLTEAYWSQGLCTRWFLGLGLNVTEAPEGAAAAPGLQRDGLAEDLAGHLAAALSRPVGADLLVRYSSQLLGWQAECGFRDRATGDAFVATPRFLSPDGRLGIQLPSGAVRWVGHKEVEWTDFS